MKRSDRRVLSLGNLSLKGKAAPVGAWQVVARRVGRTVCSATDRRSVATRASVPQRRVRELASHALREITHARESSGWRPGRESNPRPPA
jgi:hypothetical protein